MKKTLTQALSEEVQREKAASSLALLRMSARRFSLASTRVDELGEIAVAFVKRKQDGDRAFDEGWSKVSGSSIRSYADSYELGALILGKLAVAKNYHAHVYGELSKDFWHAAAYTSEKEARKALSDEFDGTPPPISKPEFSLAT